MKLKLKKKIEEEEDDDVAITRKDCVCMCRQRVGEWGFAVRFVIVCVYIYYFTKWGNYYLTILVG